MILEKERELIVEYGKKLLTSGLTKGTGGNISIANRKEGLMAISPSGVDYYETEPRHVAIMKISDGSIVDGECKPSSEHAMHRIFYTGRQDINSVVHTHSTYATTLATMGWSLPASNYMIALAGPDVRCAPYRSFGTQELAEVALEYMEDRYCVLLANHGLVAGSGDLPNAFNIAVIMEELCEQYYLATVAGRAQILPPEEIEFMMEKFKTYGQVKSVKE